MKKLLLLITVFCCLNSNAQNYLISFQGTGAVEIVSTVKVENMTAGTSLTLTGDDILRLTLVTDINPTGSILPSGLNIYPNPMIENSILEINPPASGEATISIYEMTGNPIIQIQSFLEQSGNEFKLSGINQGFYLISIKGNNYLLSGKLLCNGYKKGTGKIEKINGTIGTFGEKPLKRNNKGTLATFDMDYSTGDILKFTGISGNYSTVITDIPSQDKTILFTFVICTDGDNNNYPVVKIGTQTWMAENLKTTCYNDGTSIPNVTNSGSWASNNTGAYCDYANTPANSIIYGKLYNWYIASSTNPKNVCPAGWHVPTDGDWSMLGAYLIANGFNYDGTTGENKIAKSLAATANWVSSINAGAPGNSDYPAYRNKTGFTALPGGRRDNFGIFSVLGESGYWWSSEVFNTDYAYNLTMYNNRSFWVSGYCDKAIGFSVRCIKDQ